MPRTVRNKQSARAGTHAPPVAANLMASDAENVTRSVSRSAGRSAVQSVVGAPVETNRAVHQRWVARWPSSLSTDRPDFVWDGQQTQPSCHIARARTMSTPPRFASQAGNNGKHQTMHHMASAVRLSLFLLHWYVPPTPRRTRKEIWRLLT